ncbi:hypothetical protein O6H91_08G096700 [Diphasiastrum complanatum]|nr:hypothetical protein O6H91_08G096700 [Diphasiastrum complanatum]KAJ7547654.1 hypothetical protein O6H91_08G096700 [Diphasiastrum complanatum]KAJ7547655.1 hypothetical protein O6H91_08G096700 [Diphasiastrum complanatum]KAJ7547656.1 hypothetical protein O6H91_08G096700 [Diphasiastrum complanatum]KAJ7547657.1 hypothetical protein O6H91_08G096700 [Diphasiastrum complanatum]
MFSGKTLTLELNGLQPAVSPSPGQQPPGWEQGAWYGNIQYLINISFLGALCCILLFLIVKLRSDQRLPGPASLAAKLLAVWHTTEQQIARLCGANSVQYLAVEGYTFIAFFFISVPAVLLLLVVNLYGGKVPIQDQFAKATVAHIREGSAWLWVHAVFMLAITALMHTCIDRLESRLQATRYHDGSSTDSVSIFTLMIRGVPRILAMDKQPLEDYFEHRYPGKIFRVVVPPDLDAFSRLRSMLLKTKNELLEAQDQQRIQNHNAIDSDYFLDSDSAGSYADLSSPRTRSGDVSGHAFSSSFHWRRAWVWLSAGARRIGTYISVWGHCTLGDRIRRLEKRYADLDGRLTAYKEGRARGSGIAFVVFKDIFTASRALQDARMKSKKVGTTFSMVDMQLAMDRWKVERAPPAGDIYWQHLGRSTIERRLRTIAINAFLLLLLMFCSSPLAALTALHNASHIVGPEALEHLQLWLAWARGSSWASTFFFQFLPNVLIFLSMYVVVPAVLAYLSKFESHLTVSGEQQAVLVKTVCFFLVNLILLKALVETTLEAALVHLGQCYLDDAECKSIKQLMSSTFLATSCLSTLAFLITSSLLGISFDLLAPIPWIKRKYRLLKTRGTRTYLFEGAGALSSSTADAESNEERSLHDVLSPDNGYELHLDDSTVLEGEMTNGLDLQSQNLSVYPLAGDFHWGVQSFDFAQYYAFNVTIFAMVLIYSTFAPIVLPFGALYFGYRYIVDKYNFLFVYRVRGFPVANDGKLMGTVLRLMRVSMCLYLVAMLLFFSVRGDSERLQLLGTLALLMVVCAKYGIEKLLSAPKDGFDLSIVQGVHTVDELLNGGDAEYEVLAQPNFDWDSRVQ